MQPEPEAIEEGEGEGEDLQPLLKAALVRGQPPEIRRDFGWKVYGIVVMLISLCWATTAPFVFRVNGIEHFLERSPVFMMFCWIVLFLQIFLQLAVSGICGVCLRVPVAVKGYIWLLQTSPWNIIYLFVHALVMGCILGQTSICFTGLSMLYIFLGVCFMLVWLTVYSFMTSRDYSSVQWYIATSIELLLSAFVILWFVKHSYLVFRVWNGILASLLGAVVIMTTQLIFSTARRNPQTLEYTIDMYAFAAFELYQQFFFFYTACVYCFGNHIVSTANGLEGFTGWSVKGDSHWD
mmetsp:Transcript_64593/g.138427  ORF Transcript_64593/g.138427 Transcript_64593/m.138427 type:complete len:294 (-) Transcript_64593:67-948(-)